MAGSAIALGLGAALLFAASRGRGGGAPTAGQIACASPATAAARYRIADLVAWVTCAGRTSVEAAQLAALLERAGRAADAERVRAAWNARAEVDGAADGEMYSAQEQRAAEAALTGASPPASVVEEPRGRVIFPEVRDGEFVPERSAPSGASSTSTPRPRAPAGYNPAAARSLAPRVDRTLRSGGGSTGIIRDFQRSAGIPVDGRYGPQTRAALVYFGIATPPPARYATSAPERYGPPVIETEAVSVSGDAAEQIATWLNGGGAL